LPAIPSTILAIPLKCKPMPMNVVATNTASFGNEIAKPAKIITSIPNPIVVLRGLLGNQNNS